MSAALSDTFVPLMAASAAGGDTGTFHLTILPQGESKSAFEPIPEVARPAQAAKPCGKPSVTVQRQGESVSGIRIECGCGQIIELACSY